MLNNFNILILLTTMVLNFLYFGFWGFLTFLMIIFFLVFFLKNQHLTISLVQLEILGLMALLLMSNEIFIKEKELLFMFVCMVIVVIEASLGLSLVVKQARNLNKEFFKFLF